MLDNLAATLGVQQSLVTALVALIASVPASHVLFFMKSPTLRHIYSIIAGVGVCWVAYGGWDGESCWHHATCIAKMQCSSASLAHDDSCCLLREARGCTAVAFWRE